MTAGYPPEPWHLRGDLHASVFVVRLADIAVDLPPGWHPVRLGRFTVVTTAWVSYVPGGVLTYDELMSTLLVRRGARLLPTITHIWVDSVASRDGGRELWGIPKQLATFTRSAASRLASDDGGPIAVGTVHARGPVSARVPFGFHVLQRLGAGAKVTPVRARGRVGLASATFDAEPNGPLKFLAGRRPLVSMSLRQFRMTFGGP